MWRYLLTAVLSLLMAPPANAADARGSALPAWSVFKDPGGSLDFPAVLQRSDGFAAVTSTIFTSGYSDAAFWFRIPVASLNAESDDTTIAFHTNSLSNLTLYVGEGQSWSTRRFGDGGADSQVLFAKQPSLRLSSDRSRYGDFIYLKLTSSNLIKFSYTIENPITHTSYTHLDLFMKGIYYGIVILLTVFSFSLFLFARDRLYLTYALYVLSSGFLYLNINGLLVRDIMVLGEPLRVITFPLAHYLTTLAALYFVGDYFRLSRERWWQYWTLQALKAIGIAFVVASFYWTTFALRAVPFFGMVMATGIMVIAAFSTKGRLIEGRYFIVAWTVLLLSGVYYSLDLLGLTESNSVLPALSMQMGSMLEMIIVTFSIGYIFRKAQQTITHQRSALVSSAKMAAVGQMAAGIAHEINNPLQIIKNAAANLDFMVERKIPLSNADAHQSLQLITRTVNRIANVINALRIISRDGGQEDFGVWPLTPCIKPALALCSERIKATEATLKVDKIPSDLRFFCNPVQLSQVVLNLLNNALDAVKDIPATDPQPRIIHLSFATEGTTMRIAVSNSGDKIPAKIANRIFDPFFTTKPVGQGTGLGLSISRSIAELHKGRLYLDDAAARTTFVIELKIFNQDPVRVKSA